MELVKCLNWNNINLFKIICNKDIKKHSKRDHSSEQISLASTLNLKKDTFKQKALSLKAKLISNHYGFGAFNLSWSHNKDSIDFTFKVKLPKNHENSCWAAFGLSKDTKMVCLII